LLVGTQAPDKHDAEWIREHDEIAFRLSQFRELKLALLDLHLIGLTQIELDLLRLQFRRRSKGIMRHGGKA